MCDPYRVSSSVKVKQMEAELSQQLAALRAEIEEGGFPRGAGPANSYSSVPPPKDVSFFRTEREHTLRRELQVAEALPVQSPADVLQKELQSCLSFEYSPENLPVLLHQFYVDRSDQLAQIKYQLMLRWRRFCRHTSIIEKLYPLYKDQVSYLTGEYEDAVQRSRRLSVSREKILTGRGNSANLLTQDDVIIYLRWMICHLHSVRTIHSFLRVLHYIPASERKEKEPQVKVSEGSLKKYQHVKGPSDGVPLHTVHLEEFQDELQSLMKNFNLSYDAGNLRTTADEMELFSLVWREFRTTFRQQEKMKTFPQYDSSDVREAQWGRKSPDMALRKEADWISFIQLKPRRDPWQQKIVTQLKEKKSADELLKMHSSFLQVSDLLQVAAALKQQAAHVGDSRSSSVSNSSRTKREKISEIWTSIYNSESFTQETQSWSSRSRDGNKERSQTSSSSQTSCSFEDGLQVLGLEDGLDEETSDPVVTRGAHLSLIYLRHLKLRELQRVSLGFLNYLRSVERTLTLDLAGLEQQQEEEEKPSSSAEETRWMNAARGGRGEAGGLGSMQYVHNTPVDYKVHCSEFMQFADVENLHDFYSSEQRFIHAQDHRGFYIMYDAALKDLEELKDELLLVGSHFIWRNRIREARKTEETSTADVETLAGKEVDRAALLLDLWTCETEFLESKVQLLNCYYEAYQHAAGTEERFSLARVITDIMHRRPQLDLDQDYFVGTYRTETSCLQIHQQLIRHVLDNQIKTQRQFLDRIWRNGHKGSSNDFGLPLNYAPKHLVSLGGSSPALMNVFLLEIHPSLCLASAVYEALTRAHSELCQLHRAATISDKLNLQQKLLHQALHIWNNLPSPGASYSSQIQTDLFSDVFLDDPVLVQKLGRSVVKRSEEKDMKQGPEKQLFAVETFIQLLELVTVRHRLMEAAAETAHLAQLYRNVASEFGFDEFHLYLRPLQFEVAEEKKRTEQRPVFITEILEDDSSVDRFIPSQLPLSIQELDEDQIGRFSFSSEEAVVHLMNKQSVENLQVTLACQVSQKNALMGSVKLACVCHWAESVSSAAEESQSEDVTSDSTCGSLQERSTSRRSSTKKRLMEAFVSIQLEKAGLRDEMLNSFVRKKQAMGGFIRTPEEAAKIKRELIVDFLKKFNTQVSLHCVRAQIVAYYYSLTVLLDDVPTIRQSHFMIGNAIEENVTLDSGARLLPDPRTFQRRPQQLIGADGKTLLNLWFIPHVTELLHMFKTLDVSTCSESLHHTLQIASALHDVTSYLVGFSRLGSGGEPEAPHLAADWGGTEGIGSELQEIQRQVDRLSDSSLRSVGRLLQLRRQVVLLQFDAAVRNLIRDSLLSSGDVASYDSVSDNMATALPPLSNNIHTDVFSLTLPVPQPLEAQSYQAQRMFPWRSFMASHGLLPLRVWDVPPIEHCMQLCLSGLNDGSRLQANAAMLGVSLLMEDVLNSGGEAEPVRLHGNKDDLRHDGKPDEIHQSCTEAEEEEEKNSDSSAPLQDPIRVQSLLKGFLLLTKQLEVFKESWARRRLGADVFKTPAAYQQFVKLYRAEVFFPSMRSLAQHMGKKHDYEVLISGRQSLLPPPGASEVDVRVWQLRLLMETSECDMIRAVQKKISREMILVLSEKTRQDANLPTELWKKTPLKYSLSPERPQMVETFIQQLMDGAERTEGEEEKSSRFDSYTFQLKVSEDHLHRCLTNLGSSVMDRERRCFLLYSHFYEQILRQQTELLYHREQDLKSFKDAQTNHSDKEVSDFCRGMMLEVSALQARVAQLEDEKKTLEEKVGLRFREKYDSLVRNLHSTCIQLKARLDEYHQQMEQEVSVTVTKIRAEGVDRIIKLRRNYGCTRSNDELRLTQLKKEEVHELKLENSRLEALICKLKAVNCWRKTVDQEKLHRELLQTRQREIISRSEALRVKLISEEKLVLLQEELNVSRQVLARCQDECSRTKKLLSRKTEELQVARHQSAQEARSRKELDSYRVQSLEQMRADVDDRERQLRTLSEQLDRGSRMNRLQRQRSAKEIQQVKGQLHHERSLKQEAFQQVDKLQHQVNHMEAAFSRGTSTTGQSRTYYTLSVSRLSTRSPSAGPQQQQQQQLGSQTNSTTLQDFSAEPRHRRAETARSRSNTRIDRPRADPSRLCVLTADVLLPDL